MIQKTGGGRPANIALMAGWAVLLELAALAVVLVVSQQPLFLNRQMDADALLAVSWAEDLARHAYGAIGFELPRVPSLAPDLALQAAASTLAPTRGWALYLYAAVQFQAVVLAAAAVVDRLRPGSFLRSVTTVLALLSAVALTDIVAPRATGFATAYFEACFHVGPYVLGLLGALLAYGLTMRWRWSAAATLLVLTFAETLSDRLAVANFVLPAMAAIALANALEAGVDIRRWPSRAYGLAALLGLGAFTALVADHFLHRQPDQRHDLAHTGERLGRFVHDLAGLAPQHPWPVLAGVVLPGAVFLLYPLLAARRGKADLGPTLFFWTFGLFALAGTAALTGLVAYEDAQSLRYFGPALLWPLIFAAAAVGWLGCVRIAIWAVAAVTLIGAAPSLARTASLVPGPERWRSPVAQCLLREKDALGLQAGIAEYWTARPAMLASDWRLQLVQANPLGHPFVWGNDAFWYVTSITGQGGPPLYNYLVMTGLDPAAVRARYGEPSRVFTCPDGSATVWIYADAMKLTQTFLQPLAPPAGPYLDSCAPAVLGENRVLAACAAPGGGRRYTVLDRLGRRHGRIVNQGGRLATAP